METPSKADTNGEELTVSVSPLSLSIPMAPAIKPFISSSDNRNYFTAPETLNFNKWYDRLLYDVEQSGLYLRSAKILPNKKAIIEFSNLRYNLAADAINRVLTLSQIHLPSDINNIDLILNDLSEENHLYL